MAILSKIRDKSIFLILIVGLALVAFVLDPSTLSDFFNSNKINEVGEVNGETITRQEFANELENYKQQVGGRISDIQAAKTVWDNIIRKKIYEKQLADAGITIGEEDVWNEIINAPFVQQNPEYQNELGMFDEQKFKQFLADTKDNNEALWQQWSLYMTQIRDNSGTNTYNNLVTAGLGAALKEGEFAYLTENTKLTADYVYLPFTLIADSLVTIKKSEIEAYIKDHEKEFKVDETRDITYVKFEIKPTKQDEEVIKTEVADLIEGLKIAKDDKVFLSENDSDTDLNPNYQYKNFINQEFAEQLFQTNTGDIFGPYKDKDYYKISKVLETSTLPDSVKASHILIPYLGSQRAAEDVTRTADEAKKLADSILTLVKADKSKFADLATKFSSDKGSAEKGGDLGFFVYNTMTPAFRDFTFTKKTGDMDVVETPFGYHVIKIDEQKNMQKVVKLATLSKKIVPSEKTESSVYTQAQQFALAVTNSNFEKAANSKKLIPNPAVGLKVLDENVPGLGNERQIVSWAFEKDRKVGDFRRFDLEGSYVVATLINVTEEGVMSADKALNTVRPILVDKKKAEMLADKMNASDLASIAKNNNEIVRSASGVTFKSPTLAGVGFEPKVVGAMYYAKLNKVYKNVVGTRGVYAFKVTKKEAPVALPNYDTNRKQIADTRKRQTFKIYNALKDAAEIEDNLKMMFGGN